MNSSTQGSRLSHAFLLAVAVVMAGCSTRGPSVPPGTATTSASLPAAASESPVASAEPGASASGQIALKTYFLMFGSNDAPLTLVPVQRVVAQDPAVARAAMEQLLLGPTEQEGAHDLVVGTIGTRIPEGTRLLGIDIAAGTATVDLSSEFASGDILGNEIESWALRLAQVTYTLTQFPTVELVHFRIDGQDIQAIEGHEGSPLDAVGRGAYTDQLPGIFIDSPAWGSTLTDPLEIRGHAQTSAEPAQFQVALLDRATEAVLAQGTVRATCAPGCWQPPGGDAFSAQLDVPATAIGSDVLLRVWEGEAGDITGNTQFDYPLH